MISGAIPATAARCTPAARLMLGLLAVFSVALVLRVVVFERGLVSPAQDEKDYLAIAGNIAESGSFSAGPDRAWEERYRSPLFPYLIAPFVAADGHEHRLRIGLAIVASCFPLAAFGLGAAASRPGWCCWLLAAFAALHPIHAQSSTQVLPDALATCLLCLAYALEFLTIAPHSAPARRAAARSLSAFTLGVTIALRTHLAIGAIPLLARWLGLALRGRDRPRLALLTLLAFLAAPLPLTLLRSSQERHFLPLTDTGTMLFWLGNSPHSLEYLEGTRNFELDFVDLYGAVGDRRTPPSLPVRDALRFIDEQPSHWLILKARMLWNLWSPIPSFREDSSITGLDSLSRTAVRVAKAFWRGLVFALLCAGSVIGYKRWHLTEPRLMLIALVLLTLFGALFFPSNRYRMAIDIFLPALASWNFAGSATPKVR